MSLKVYRDDFIEMDKYKSAFQDEIESIVVDGAPWPISFDVDPKQPPRFSEFSYTDCLRGFYINTQSVEINCRLIEEASKNHCDDFTVLDGLREVIGDKYPLDPAEKIEGGYEIGFMVGQNMFDIVSTEIVARLAHEKNNFYMKLHPLTDEDFARRLAFHVGRHRLISNSITAYSLLRSADVVHTSTASELTMAAVIYDKPVRNMSNFFNESSGIYYPISRLLYSSENPRQVLNNIINCQFSGVILPGVTDIEKRIECYYNKAFELRESHGNISTKSNLVKES